MIMSRKEQRRMTIEELDELLTLRGWSKTELAVELDLTEAAVWKWYRLNKIPAGPVSILLRDWLKKARKTNLANAS